MTPDARIVYCTCPDEACGERIAGMLVNESLAACVTLLPGAKSVYQWEGALCQDTEVLLMIKTTDAKLADLETRIVQEHPYQVPEVIAVPVIAGLRPYLEWIHTCTFSPT